jgi:hypothetical protein
VPLLKHLQAHDVSYEVLFPTERDGVQAPLLNPTVFDWRDLVDRGFPFLKVELIRDRPLQSDPTGWENRISDARLVRQIQDHLATVQNVPSRGLAVHRPIPSPSRRFKRNRSLQTSYGATPACRPTDATDLALEVPFRYSPANDERATIERVAVIAHLFYPEMSEQFLDRIQNIPLRADVFISTDTDEKKTAINRTFSSYANGGVETRVFPNRGRDLAPLLVGYADVIRNYEVMLHIHSPHNRRLGPWRDFLLDNLLGSPEIVGSILEVLSATDVGIVFSRNIFRRFVGC